MTVRRIVANVTAGDPAASKAFYRDLFDLEVAMDMGWIVTFTADGQRMTPQVSVMSEGGSGTPVPDLSIEVEDVDATHRRAEELGLEIAYGPVDEPWGVRRFYLRDPNGRLLNVLSHRE